MPIDDRNSPMTDASERATRILICDDDVRLRALIRRHLEEAGFQVRDVGTAQALKDSLLREHCDLIVLDLMLPDLDGLEICARLRQRGINTPVLMLTARGDDADRIRGLEIGADDYLAKPCNARELVARVRAILRRSRLPPGAPQALAAPICFGGFELDVAHRELRRDGQAITLSTGDFALLTVLARNPGKPLSRERLHSLLGHADAYQPEDRAIDMRVARLRRLLEDDPARPRHLQTVWGIGYCMVLDP